MTSQTPTLQTPTLTLLLALLLAACAPTTTNRTAPATTTPPMTTPVAPPPVATAPATPAGPNWAPVPYLSAQAATSYPAPAQVIDPARQYRAVLVTSKGDVTLALRPDIAPKAVNSFVFLALNHFYDGTPFHRVVPGFVAQGGDPLGTGTGGPGYTFGTETSPAARFDSAGVLGQARSASPDSNGSQFFITLAPADFLSSQYTVFGKVTAGQNVVDSLTKTYTAQGGPVPGVTPDYIRSVRIEAAPR